jgi:NADH-quinone oxidoreductase subunit M
MVAHGITTAALFLLLGFLLERRTASMEDYGGLAAVMPRYTVLFWIALFASIGLPGLAGFAGEYLILQGSMAANFWYALVAASGVIWSAVYMLRMFRRVMYGEITQEQNRNLPDVRPREWVVAALVLAVSVWMGVAPRAFLDVIGPRAGTVIETTRSAQSTLAAPLNGALAER